MKLNENDIRTLNRLMETERQLREIMIGNEGDYDDTHDPVTIYGIIHDMADLLYEGAEIIKETGDLVQHYEENDWEDDEDEEDFDDDDLSFMVMIAEPGEEFAVLTEDEAIEMYPELFPRGDSSKELIPVPNIPDVYYTVPSQSRMTLKEKTYVASPIMVVKVDEEAGEFISPDAMDLYRAAKFLDKHLSQITTKSGRVIPAFCLD
jgi:hypothetical protein